MELRLHNKGQHISFEHFGNSVHTAHGLGICLEDPHTNFYLYSEGKLFGLLTQTQWNVSIWPQLKTMLVDTVKTMKMGPTDDFSNFINAVIDERSFDKSKDILIKQKRIILTC